MRFTQLSATPSSKVALAWCLLRSEKKTRATLRCCVAPWGRLARPRLHHDVCGGQVAYRYAQELEDDGQKLLASGSGPTRSRVGAEVYADVQPAAHHAGF